MMLEIYGRKGGLCKGKGGSMHIADVTRGMLGANGIVGAGAPIALGAAISAKLDGAKQVSVAFSGDGACNQGTTFEAMNMAVVLKLPLLFVFENNHYSEHTGVDYAVGSKNIAARAAAFGMATRRADGCDFFASYAAAREMIELCRQGGGPAAIEFDTERFFGHFEGDPQRYRGPGEVDRLRRERDCLANFRRRVLAEGLLGEDTLNGVDADSLETIEQAVSDARKAEAPAPTDVEQDVYVTY
jgi:pyruvate dehydrogenase E1 component alpha subunit